MRVTSTLANLGKITIIPSVIKVFACPKISSERKIYTNFYKF